MVDPFSLNLNIEFDRCSPGNWLINTVESCLPGEGFSAEATSVKVVVVNSETGVGHIEERELSPLYKTLVIIGMMTAIIPILAMIIRWAYQACLSITIDTTKNTANTFSIETQAQLKEFDSYQPRRKPLLHIFHLECHANLIQSLGDQVAQEFPNLKTIIPTNVEVFRGSSALHNCKNGNIAKLLINGGADVNALDEEQSSPLHLADNDVTKVLIQHGADVSLRDCFQRTPLMTCANDPVTVNLLLRAGADPNAKDNLGNTAISNCFMDKSIELLLNKGAIITADSMGKTPLHRAASSIDQDRSVTLLLDAGAEVNALDSNKNTPLHHVKRPEIARILIERGADVHAVNAQGQTPLDTAIAARHQELVSFLQKKIHQIPNPGERPERIEHPESVL